MEISEYLDRAKARTAIQSDRQLAAALGLKPGYNFKFLRIGVLRPSETAMRKLAGLAGLAGIDPALALLDLKISKHRHEPTVLKTYCEIRELYLARSTEEPNYAGA